MKTETEIRQEMNRVQGYRVDMVGHLLLHFVFHPLFMRFFMPIIRYAELIGQLRFGWWVLEGDENPEARR